MLILCSFDLGEGDRPRLLTQMGPNLVLTNRVGKIGSILLISNRVYCQFKCLLTMYIYFNIYLENEWYFFVFFIYLTEFTKRRWQITRPITWSQTWQSLYTMSIKATKFIPGHQNTRLKTILEKLVPILVLPGIEPGTFSPAPYSLTLYFLW